HKAISTHTHVFFIMLRLAPRPTLFPYTTLFRSLSSPNKRITDLADRVVYWPRLNLYTVKTTITCERTSSAATHRGEPAGWPFSGADCGQWPADRPAPRQSHR